ncbi:MAG: hypothetical protein WCY77_10305 [Weeksellaceae bacterium]
MTNETKQGQSFLDMVLQETGSIEEALKMAVANNRSLTDDLKIGESIQGTKIINQKVVDFFTPEQKKPATAWNKTQFVTKPEGISFWAINVDFEVTPE